MPKFSSVDVLFTRTPEGWTFKSAYPRIFRSLSTYLLTDAQKEAFEQRLNRYVLMSKSQNGRVFHGTWENNAPNLNHK